LGQTAFNERTCRAANYQQCNANGLVVGQSENTEILLTNFGEGLDVCCPIALRIKAGKTNQKFLTI